MYVGLGKYVGWTSQGLQTEFWCGNLFETEKKLGGQHYDGFEDRRSVELLRIVSIDGL